MRIRKKLSKPQNQESNPKVEYFNILIFLTEDIIFNRELLKNPKSKQNKKLSTSLLARNDHFIQLLYNLQF